MFGISLVENATEPMKLSVQVKQSTKVKKSANGREVRHKEGKLYIYFRPTKGGKKIFKGTPFDITDVDKWDNKSLTTTSLHDSQKVKDFLAFKVTLENRIEEAINNKEIISPKSIGRMIEELREVKTEDDAKYIRDITFNWIKEKYDNKESLETMIHHLKAFIAFEDAREELSKEDPLSKNIQIRFRYEEINRDVLMEYQEYLQSRYGKGSQTASRRFKAFKTLIGIARERGHKIDPECSFVKAKKYKKSPIITLNREEIQQIKDAEGLSPYLENTRKWLMIGLTTGMRVKDLLQTKKEDFKYRKEKDYWYRVYAQSKVSGVIPTTPIADQWVVDNVISGDFPHKISDVKYNEYLKKLCDFVGINTVVEANATYEGSGSNKKIQNLPKWKVVSSHIVRRTFATLGVQDNIPISLLMQITGHKLESTFWGYVGLNPTDHIHADKYMEYKRQSR